VPQTRAAGKTAGGLTCVRCFSKRLAALTDLSGERNCQPAERFHGLLPSCAV